MALNDVGGFRNTMVLVLTGLDIEAKAAHAEVGVVGMEAWASEDPAVALERFRTAFTPPVQRPTP